MNFDVLNENPKLIDSLNDPNTLILWPGEDIPFIEDMKFQSHKRTIIAIDGTW